MYNEERKRLPCALRIKWSAPATRHIMRVRKTCVPIVSSYWARTLAPFGSKEFFDEPSLWGLSVASFHNPTN